MNATITLEFADIAQMLAEALAQKGVYVEVVNMKPTYEGQHDERVFNGITFPILEMEPTPTNPLAIGEVRQPDDPSLQGPRSHEYGTSDDEHQYTMGRTTNGELAPFVRSPITGKAFVIPWDHIIRLGFEAGIDKE